MRMTPRRFFDAARSGWRASMASSCFSASGNLPASNARYAVLYISSNSALVGATLSAANGRKSQRCDRSDLPDSHEPPIQALISIPDKSKLRSARRFSVRFGKTFSVKKHERRRFTHDGWEAVTPSLRNQFKFPTIRNPSRVRCG